MSFRIRHRLIGGHVEARVFASEFGPETSHGLSGVLRFRPQEWEAFRRLLEFGADTLPLGEPVVAFVDETEAAEQADADLRAELAQDAREAEAAERAER